MSSAGRAVNSNGCAIKPKGREIGLLSCVVQIRGSSNRPLGKSSPEAAPRGAVLRCIVGVFLGSGGLTMPGGMKLIDSSLVIVLHNGEQEIERELAPPRRAHDVGATRAARNRRRAQGAGADLNGDLARRRKGGLRSALFTMNAHACPAHRAQGAERQLM